VVEGRTEIIHQSRELSPSMDLPSLFIIM
jgi:hypothetical protein